MTASNDVEFASRLAKATPPDAGIGYASAISVLIINLFKLLIEKGLLSQGEAMGRLERLSRELMTVAAHQEANRSAVLLIDMVRDAIANELDRKPS